MMALLSKLLERLGRRSGAPAAVAANAASKKALGNAALAAGDLTGAVSAYRQAVTEDGRDAAAHLNLGYALLQQGLAGEAEQSLHRALALDETLADAHYLLGGARQAQGSWSAARDSFLCATRMRPDFDFAWRDLAMACEQLGEPAEALENYERAALLRPDFLEAVAGCARLHLQQHNPEAAARWARQWAVATPEAWEPAVLLAQALLALNRPAEALVALDDAQHRGNGVHAVISLTRGNALFALHRFAEAASTYEVAAQAQPDMVQALINGAVAHQRLGRPDAALAMLARSLTLEPENSLALYNRTVCLLDAGRLDEAIAAGEQALSARPGDPDLEWNLGLANLLAGRLEQGWPALETRWRTGILGPHGLPSVPQPRWTGAEPVEGKTVLLLAEQGLGDSIQFVRYAPWLLQRGARVVLWMPAALEGLLRHSLPECEIVTTSAQLPQVDFQCPLMSLPLAFNTSLQDIPAQERYLHSDPALRDVWTKRLGPLHLPRIGLVWSGSGAHKNDRNRSIPLSAFLPLARSAYQFVSLQKEVRDGDKVFLAEWPGLVHFGEDLVSFADTAALIDTLDLVISVDTSVAHLAAALGKPVWLLLPYRPDWRWLMQRSDSPWYPTVRLFRQDEMRAWAPVLDRVRLELAQRADAEGAVRKPG